MKIWLDDIRQPPKDWIWCKTSLEIILLLCGHFDQVTEMSLDHDLWNGGCGYDVLLWLEKEVVEGNIVSLPLIHIHSMNPVGRMRMKKALKSIKKRLEEISL